MIAKITRFYPLSPTVWGLDFTSEEAFSFRAGQYILADLLGEGAIPLSLCSAPSEKVHQLCIKGGGEAPLDIRKLKSQDTFAFSPAEGEFFFESVATSHIVFIATGTGVSPLRSMILENKKLLEACPSVSLLLGVCNSSEILFAKEWDSMKFVNLHPCLFDPKKQPIQKGMTVTEAMEVNHFSLDWQYSDFYICGHTEMVLDVRNILLQNGVPAARIFHEKWIPIH